MVEASQSHQIFWTHVDGRYLSVGTICQVTTGNRGVFLKHPRKDQRFRVKMAKSQSEC